MSAMSMVVCPEPHAAEVGRDVFAAGGNAIDAAVATAFAQGVTDPLLTGIGGMGLLYYYDHGTRRALTLDCGASIGSRPLPASWPAEFLGRSETVGRYILRGEANQVGYQSVMTPGVVKGCWVAFQRFGSGKLAWAELLAPAIRLARTGFTVYPFVAISGGAGEGKPGYPSIMRKLHATPDMARRFLRDDGTPYQPGDWLVQAELADTLERLARAGGDDFYTGELAQMIAEDFARHDGFITADDLRDYRVREYGALRAAYRGLEITSAPAPGSGPQLIQMLKMLEHFDIAALGHNTPAYIDIFARIQRASFSDNVRVKGMEPEQAQILLDEIVSDERSAEWATRIRDGERIVVRGGAVDPGTTHVTVIDAERNVVSFTHSVGSLAASGVITPGLGFVYNNFLGHYNPLPGQPDSIEPGKRLAGGLPAIVFRDGEPYMALGAPGGSRIITSVTQAIANVHDFGMDMETAVTVPRFHSEEEQRVFLEPAFPVGIDDELRALGNEVQRTIFMSCVQAIRVGDDGALEAGPDPRGGAGVGHYP